MEPAFVNAAYQFDAAGSLPVNRVDICRAAISLDPRCADAYATLASFLDGGSVEVNGKRVGVVQLRDTASRIRFDIANTASSAPSLHVVQPPTDSVASSTPPSRAKEIDDYCRGVAVLFTVGGGSVLGTPAYTDLKPAIDRDVTQAWLRASCDGVTAPDHAGHALSESFTTAVNCVFSGGPGFAQAFDTLLSMSSNDGGVAPRRYASAQLYLALAFVSVDAPVSLDAMLADVARVWEHGARHPTESPFMTDARRSLQAYRTAVINGSAFWDHASLLI